MAEALVLARQDPELARWFAEHCALYEQVRDKLKKIPVPPWPRAILRKSQTKRIKMTILVQYLPRWVRGKLPWGVPRQRPRENEIERESAPAADQPLRPARWQDDDSPPGYRVLWRH